MDGQQVTALAPGALGLGTEEAPLVLFGDASGGPEGHDPHLRRVGLAVARAHLVDGGLVQAAWGGLSGSTQTVHRGELRALVLAAQGPLGPA
eukprot:3257683-Pyramimonas_sp.AAC.1